MQVSDIPLDLVFRNTRGRRVSLLAPGSAERRQAEQVARKREQGLTMRQIEAETGLSLSTLRRLLNRLILTKEIEAGVFDKEIRKHLPGGRGRPSRKAPGRVAAMPSKRKRVGSAAS